MKTVLIQNGSYPKGLELIRNLLAENNHTDNFIKNRVICVDKPEKVYDLQGFLSYEEFTFLPLTEDAHPDVRQNIDEIIIVPENV